MVDSAVGLGCSSEKMEDGGADDSFHSHDSSCPQNYPPITRLKVLLGEKMMFYEFFSHKIWGR